MYAKFSNGLHPGIFLRPSPEGNLNAYVISEYVPYEKLPTFTKLLFGSTGLEN